MKKYLVNLVCGLGFLAAGNTSAALISVTPDEALSQGVNATTPFGTLDASGEVADSLVSFGIDFSYGNVEGFFDDGGGVYGFCGINASNICDLITDVDGRIVDQGTTNQALTNFIQLEAGFMNPDQGTLSVFDSAMNLLETVTGAGTGPFGRSLFTINRASTDIAFFNFSSTDSYGVNQITIEAGTVQVPEPMSVMLLGLGLIGLVSSRKRN